MKTNLEVLLGAESANGGGKILEGIPELIAPLYQSNSERHLLSNALWIFDPQDIVDGKFTELYLGTIASGQTGQPVPFAADAFGDLYAVSGSTILKVETETGVMDAVAHNLEEWASVILADPDVEVGESFLREWERTHGTMSKGERLHPRMPFIFGGGYDDENIVAMPLPEILKFRAELARQTSDLPDGARITLET